MVPDDAIAVMMKVVFVLSATCVLLMSRVRASDLPPISQETQIISEFHN